MLPCDLIKKKRDGGTHTAEELMWIVNGYTAGDIPDYQMSAWLMCVYNRGMNEDEIFALTDAMAKSGDMLDLSGIRGVKVDKHSTGGVGDKTTLIVAPILASLGVPVAKMSGRGLGHTGGTIDKLEAIPGFSVSLSEEDFIRQVNTVGMAVAAQTGNLVPADKKIYALRDVTATVDSLPLIASSVMSKKLAAGADAIVLDVKCGSGAFMQDEDAAEELARTMVAIGQAAGRTCIGIITDMNEPLGCKVGNALEVIEAISVLSGQGSRMYANENITVSAGISDGQQLCERDMANESVLVSMNNLRGTERLVTVSLTLAAYMYMAAGRETDFDAAYKTCEQALASGAALAKFREFVQAQGGDVRYVDDVSLFETAKYRIPVRCTADGYLAACDTGEVGMVNLMLGGGRRQKGNSINPRVGIDICRTLGDTVKSGDVLAYLHADDEALAAQAEKRLLAAYTISDQPVKPQKLVKRVVR